LIDKSKINALNSVCQQKVKINHLSLRDETLDRKLLLREFSAHPTTFVASLPRDGGMILKCLLWHRNDKFNRIRNKVLARIVGCSVRTVQRWTAYFVLMGLIEKSQRGIYTPNDYVVRLSKRGSFSLWLNSLSPEEQELKSQGIWPKSVTTRKQALASPKENFGILSNRCINIKDLFSKLTPLNSRARVKKGEDFQKKYEKDKNRLVDDFLMVSKRGLVDDLRRESVLTEIQSKWIHDHRGDSNVGKFIMSDRVKPYLYTPLVREIQELLGFTDQECLKLAIYPDEAQKYALEKAHNLKKARETVRVKSVVGWFVSMMTNYCENHKLFYDKSLYFDLCRILEIESNIAKEINRPFTVVKFGERRVEDPSKTMKLIKKIDEERDRVEHESSEDKIRSLKELSENSDKRSAMHNVFAQFAAIGIKNSMDDSVAHG